MKALVLVKNGELVVQNRILDKLDNNKVRLKVKYCGICSSDIERAFGNGAYFYPLIMGHEISAEVVEIGSKVKEFKKGDRVVLFPLIPCNECFFCKKELYAGCSSYKYYGSRNDGGYCEYMDVLPWNIIKIPKYLSYEDASLLEPFSVVLNALKKTDVFQDKYENIAVIGAGFLGLIAVSLILNKTKNTKITLIDRNNFKLEKINSPRITKICLTDEKKWGKYIDSNIKQDMVLEATGSPKCFKYSIQIASVNGIIVWMGNITNDLKIDKKTVSLILRKELTIKGTWNSVYKNKDNDDWHESLKLMKYIKPSNFVTHKVSMEEAAEILLKMYHHKTSKKKFQYIKILIDIEKEAG